MPLFNKCLLKILLLFSLLKYKLQTIQTFLSDMQNRKKNAPQAFSIMSFWFCIHVDGQLMQHLCEPLPSLVLSNIGFQCQRGKLPVNQFFKEYLLWRGTAHNDIYLILSSWHFLNLTFQHGCIFWKCLGSMDTPTPDYEICEEASSSLPQQHNIPTQHNCDTTLPHSSDGMWWNAPLSPCLAWFLNVI